MKTIKINEINVLAETLAIRNNFLQKRCYAVSRKRGQSIVEFAIVFPMFIMFTFACLFTGMMMHDYMAIGELTREVARYEAVGTKVETIITDLNIDKRLTGMYKINYPKDIKVNYPNDGELGERVVVTVTMHRNDKNIIFLVDKFMPKQLSTSLVMRRE